MRLPFELFDDYDCITHDIEPISLSEEFVEYRVLSRYSKPPISYSSYP